MTTVATLWVELGLDSSKYNKGLTDATNSTSGLGGVMQSVGNIAGTVLKAGFIAAAAGAVALGKGIFDSVQAAAEAQDVQAQLNAVLESTGGIAGVTADEVNRLADTLSGVTKFEDEAIISGENLLLTFTNIGKDIFPEATEVMLDMSQALGQDLKSSAIQLGKALQDPVLGVTALRRVGVNFNDEQKKMIESMVEAGDVAGAQAFILKELQTEFGGSARAAGSTFAGQLEILKNKLGNVKEEIGAALLPVLTDLAKQFNEFLSDPAFQARLDRFIFWIQNEAVPWIVDKLIPALANVVAWFTDVFIPKIGEWSEAMAGFFENVKTGFEDFKTNNQTEFAAISILWDQLVGHLNTLWDMLFGKLGAQFPELGDVGKTAMQAIAIGIHVVDILVQGLIKWVEIFQALWEQTPERVIAFIVMIGDAITNHMITPILNFLATWQEIQSLNAGNAPSGAIQAAPNLGVLGFASGGSFTVPPGFSGDSFPMRVSSGEQVSVTPPGQSNNGGMSDQQLKTLAKYIGMEFSKVMG
jgi:hypothetical protein